MSTTDDLLKNNESFAQSFNKGDLPLPPARKIAIVACMDARLNPYPILGLELGDAHVIRNAGGVITDDEIRSLAISQHLLGTEEIMLIHHTDCGMLTFNDQEFAGQARGGDRPTARVGGALVRRPRPRRPGLDPAHQEQPVHPAHRQRARLRLRRRQR